MSRDVGLGAGRSSLAGNTQDSSTRGLLSFLQELGALLQSRRAGKNFSYSITVSVLLKEAIRESFYVYLPTVSVLLCF